MNIGHEVLYLSQADVAAINLPMKEVMAILDAAYLEKHSGRVDMPPKLGVSPGREGFAHAMPCWLPGQGAMGMKWVNGCPENRNLGLPFLGGLCVLNDPQTCMPVCIMDCVWITAKRTGGKSGVCARHLARPDSKTLGILGCGVQGYSNLEAMSLALPGLERVLVYDVRFEAAQRLAESQSHALGLPITAVATPEEAVRPSDVLVTAGLISPHAPRTIRAEWLKKGVTLIPVDLDCMFTAEAVAACHRYFTDDLELYDLFAKAGFFSTVPKRPEEACRAFAGAIPGRTSPEENILVLNNGMALDDISVAWRIYEEAVRQNKGTVLPL